MSFKSGLEKIVDGAKSLKRTLPVIGALALATTSAYAAQGKGYLGHSHSNGNNIVQAEGEVFFPLIQNSEGDYLDAFHIKGEVKHDVDLEETTGEYDAAWVHRFYDGVPSVWSEMGVRNDVYGSEENNEHGYLGLTLRSPVGPFMADVEGQVLLDDERVGGGAEIGANYYDGTFSVDLEFGAYYTGDTEEDIVTGGEVEFGINGGSLFDSKVFNYLNPTIQFEFEQGEQTNWSIGNTWYFNL
jgi:hypothetical protein